MALNLLFVQITPYEWDLASKVQTVLKPALTATKAAEGDNVSISDVIPLVKKLKHEVQQTQGAGIGTLKNSLLDNIDRFVFVYRYLFTRTLSS